MTKRFQMTSVRAWSAPAAMLACALALALAASFIPLSQASAYFNFGTVGVSLGTTYVSLTAGASTNVSVSVNPASSDQTQGCGMAKCPQVCDTKESIAAGYSCFDANGQCTCSGKSYSTYYPQSYASSSNSGVASAYMSGSTLVITANGAGSATITVGASLRQYTDGAAYVQVDVSAPPAPVEPPSSGGSSSGGTSSGGSSGGSSSSGDAPAALPSAAPSSSGVPEAAEAVESRDDDVNEKVMETEGGTVVLAECNSHLDAPATLAKIVGTEDQVIFWSGTSSERPDYSWTFTGDKLKEGAADLPFDPAISVSKLGTGNVANIMKQAKDGIVLDFAHSGDLPGEASVYVNVDSAFADGTVLKLYCFDPDKVAFGEVEAETTVEAGYASFKLSHCSTWALSTDDLSGYELQETNTPGAKKQSVSDDSNDSIASDEGVGAWLVPAAAGVVALAVVALVAVLVVRKKKRAAEEDRVEEQPADGEADDAESPEAADASVASEADDADSGADEPAADEPDPVDADESEGEAGDDDANKAE